jgi:hypothetical protein
MRASLSLTCKPVLCQPNGSIDSTAAVTSAAAVPIKENFLVIEMSAMKNC